MLSNMNWSSPVYSPGSSMSQPISPDLFTFVLPQLTPEQLELHQLRQEVADLRQQLGSVGVSPAMLHAPSTSSGNRNNQTSGAGRAHHRRVTRPADHERRSRARSAYFHLTNRNGNRKCAWCFNRREGVEIPSRGAPQGIMNCGCTVEEAMFEQTLARNGVGSIAPGKGVTRMASQIRAGLLHLLKERYGYVDGDFDFDATTGRWVSGESPEEWEQRARQTTRN